jgi:hypothetical protein
LLPFFCSGAACFFLDWGDGLRCTVCRTDALEFRWSRSHRQHPAHVTAIIGGNQLKLASPKVVGDRQESKDLFQRGGKILSCSIAMMIDQYHLASIDRFGKVAVVDQFHQNRQSPCFSTGCDVLKVDGSPRLAPNEFAVVNSRDIPLFQQIPNGEHFKILPA